MEMEREWIMERETARVKGKQMSDRRSDGQLGKGVDRTVAREVEGKGGRHKE